MFFNCLLFFSVCVLGFSVPKKVFITEDINRIPFFENEKFDYIVYNTSDVKFLSPYSLDALLLDTSNSLNTMGTVLLNVSDSVKGVFWYNYLLENPEELWNYDLVSVEISGTKIMAKKGSSMIFKDRELLKISREYNTTVKSMENDTTFDDLGFLVVSTGDTQIDKIINIAGVFLQYTILFNFFSFCFLILFEFLCKYHI